MQYIQININEVDLYKTCKDHLEHSRTFVEYILNTNFTTNKLQNVSVFIIIHISYMLRPYILAIFREFQVWSTRTAYMNDCAV